VRLREAASKEAQGTRCRDDDRRSQEGTRHLSVSCPWTFANQSQPGPTEPPVSAHSI
jgi:hypothetical protein